MKNLINSILFCTYILSLSVFGSPDILQADSSQITSGGAAQVSVSFRIVIPPSLYLQVQSAPSDTIQATMLSNDGIITTSNDMENETLNVSNPSRGIYTYHFSDKINPSIASPVEYQPFILCSP